MGAPPDVSPKQLAHPGGEVANQTWLLGDRFNMSTVANPSRHRQCQNGFVDDHLPAGAPRMRIICDLHSLQHLAGVPLCRGHHREVHRCGHEVVWWENFGIDPTVSARTLWLKSHPLPPTL